METSEPSVVMGAGPARWFALAAVIGPILFTLAWLILGQLSPPYYGPLFTVAKHSGIAVPIDWLALGWTRPFMNTACVLCGLLLLGGIIGIFDAIREMGTLARWTCTLLLALSPLGLVLCGIIPVDSMFLYGSPDKITRALFVPSTTLNHYQLHDTYFVATSLFPPFANPLHTLGFLLAVASPVLSFFVVGLLLRRIPRWRRFGSYLLSGSPLTLALVLFFFATFIPLLMARVREPGFTPLATAGIAERILILEVQAWFVALGWLAFTAPLSILTGEVVATVFASVEAVLVVMFFFVETTTRSVVLLVLLATALSIYPILRLATRPAWRAAAIATVGLVSLLFGWHVWPGTYPAVVKTHSSQMELRLSVSFKGPGDATRLKTGLFRYRDLVKGSEVGASEISIRRDPASGNFTYSNRVTGRFGQQWESIATAAFVPISAKLFFGEGENLRSALELAYQAGRVTGFALTKQHSRQKVEAEVDADTVDQRIDWAAAMSQELTPGQEFKFHVFDPVTGNSGVTGQVAGYETVRVPAGSFEAVRIVYRIEKANGAETYQLLATRQGPTILLKEEFPNGATAVLTEARD